MKTTIEEINGKLFTVIWHKNVTQSGYCFDNLRKRNLYFQPDGIGYLIFANNFYAAALPALPRNPKPEDTRLIHRYLAEGIVLSFATYDEMGEFMQGYSSDYYPIKKILERTEITLCPDPRNSETGEKVEVAIV